MKPLVSLLFLLLSILSVTAQNKAALKPDTIIKEVPVYSKMQADSLQEVYFEILKSTNEQLNNYWTPWNWILGVLALLFTVGSVYAAILIYRQSKDFTDKRDETISKVEADSEKLKKELKEGVEKTITEKSEEFERLLTSTREAMEALAMIETTEIKKVIVDHIRNSGNWLVIAGYPPPPGFQRCLYVCPQETCHHIWKGQISEIEMRNIHSTIHGGRPPVLKKCPKCDQDFFLGKGRSVSI